MIGVTIGNGNNTRERKTATLRLVGSLKGFYTSTDPEIARKHKEETHPAIECLLALLS